jgi:hypothetical protein
MMMDYNDAGPQRTFEVIPERTIVPVQLTIHPGDIGEGGWLTRAKDGASEHLNCEFVVTEGQYAKRKFWARLTVGGTTPKHAEAAEITRRTIRAVLEAARSIRPDDKSETAKKARIADYGHLDGIRFLVRVGVEPASNGYPAKNFVREVITPDRREWRAIEQVPRPSGEESAAIQAGANSAIPAVVDKPNWAK